MALKRVHVAAVRRQQVGDPQEDVDPGGEKSLRNDPVTVDQVDLQAAHGFPEKKALRGQEKGHLEPGRPAAFEVGQDASSVTQGLERPGVKVGKPDHPDALDFFLEGGSAGMGRQHPQGHLFRQMPAEVEDEPGFVVVLPPRKSGGHHQDPKGIRGLRIPPEIWNRVDGRGGGRIHSLESSSSFLTRTWMSSKSWRLTAINSAAMPIMTI